MRNSNRPFTQPHSEVYCGYFRRLVFRNSLTFSHIPPCFHAKPPDFPRLIGPRVTTSVIYILGPILFLGFIPKFIFIYYGTL